MKKKYPHKGLDRALSRDEAATGKVTGRSEGWEDGIPDEAETVRWEKEMQWLAAGLGVMNDSRF